MLKKSLILSTLFSPFLSAATINMAEFVPTDAQYKSQIEDYTVFVRPSVKEKNGAIYVPNIVYAHNQDKSNCLLLQAREVQYCSYVTSVISGACYGGFIGAFISTQRMGPFVFGTIAGAALATVICAAVNISKGKRLHVDVLDCKADKTADRHEYEWIARPGNHSLDKFAKYWIEHKCGKGEAFERLTSPKGLFLGKEGIIRQLGHITNMPQSPSDSRSLKDLQGMVACNDAWLKFKYKDIEN